MTDIVCKEGADLAFCQRKLSWLQQATGRRLFLIGDAPLFQDSRVRVFPLDTPLHKEFVAQQIGMASAFKTIEVIDEEWRGPIQKYQQIAQAILSDTADFGVPLFQNLQIHTERKMGSFLALEGSLEGVPAIVVGAGPSLEAQQAQLEEWKQSAFLIAAGSAVECIKTAPHLALAIDGHQPLVRKQFLDTPLCIQVRVHPESLQGVTGPLLYLPDSHFAFEPWLMGQDSCFHGGWTVGNTAIAMAAHLGCNPIVLVGMDFCYRGTQKYAHRSKGQKKAQWIQAMNGRGKTVWTQTDWLLANRWISSFALSHPETTFYHVEAEGLPIGAPVQAIERLKLPEKVIDPVWQNAPRISLSSDRLAKWKNSLEEKGPLATELLLEPLWRYWGPFFERELMEDVSPFSIEQKVALQKSLFFDRVTQEHLNAFRTD